NLYGTDFDDTLIGSDQDNTLIGYGGSDLLSGLEGNDSLRGEDGADQLLGGAGNDVLHGGAGADLLDGGEGRDSADYRGTGAAVAVNLATGTATGGTAEGDTFLSIENLYGTDFDDTLIGSDQDNTLIGYGGNDVLSGGLGNDTLTGGAGNDIFVFDTALSATTNRDTLSDFVVGQDIIKLDKDVFTALTTAGTLSSANFNSSATGAAGDANDYILYNTTSGTLLYDADGNGSGTAVQFATLTTKPAITASDCMVAA
uniref:calcium-binding protein n=1 Tax=Desulfobulbus sp. TaxID=895 RepID=UPI0027B9BC9B